MPRFVTTMVKRQDFHVNHLLTAAFPDYRRLSVRIVPATEVTLSELNWDGGTRSEYCKLHVEHDGSIRAIPIGDHLSHPAHNRDEGRTVSLDLGTIVVRAGTFCGKPSLATIYVRPDDIERILGFNVASTMLVEHEVYA
jgi:hypothetical protein